MPGVTNPDAGVSRLRLFSSPELHDLFVRLAADLDAGRDIGTVPFDFKGDRLQHLVQWVTARHQFEALVARALVAFGLAQLRQAFE